MIINPKRISEVLEHQHDLGPSHVREVLAKARELKGIDFDDVLTLLKTTDPELVQELFQTARYVKDEIYGNRVVLFAPLYVSNLCMNECLYCAFRASNKEVDRAALGMEDVRKETEALIDQGHKRVLLVSGEAYPREGLNYIFKSIDTVYATKTPKGSIRRINVNIAPLSVNEFKELNRHQIGTYQLFQETYHEETYKKLHPRGPKSDYHYRLSVMDRAFEGGLHDVGIGVLFGLYDWRYEVLAMLDHIKHLENRFGVGPHTISVPRIEPAVGSDLSNQPPHEISDLDFQKIIAVLRMAVPYTGIILSTRENAEMRRHALNLGVSQISAGSRTNPGGYCKTPGADAAHDAEQFSLGDTRSLQEVLKDIVSLGHIPSFCTGCYRRGRVGKDFMDLAKPGLIKAHCLPNAILTFAEYLEDFGDAELRDSGYGLIDRLLNDQIPQGPFRKGVEDRIASVRGGKRDLYY